MSRSHRLAAASALALIATTSIAHADKTLGVEWEFDATVGVIGVTVAGEPDTFDGHLATDSGRNFRPDTVTPQDGGQRILCSVATANEKYPLVSITHDMMWANDGDPFGAMTLEIVTGPIDYRKKGDWDGVATFTTRFFHAVEAVCRPTALAVQRIEGGLPVMGKSTTSLCYATAAQIVAEMNRANPGIAQDNHAGACEGNDPQKAENPKTVGVFFTHGIFSFNDITDVTAGNTQVNVGVDLATLAAADLGPLFQSGHGIAASAYARTRAKIEELGGPPALRGFRTLYAYAVSTAAYGKSLGGEYSGAMVANKNLYDLYPKSPLGAIYALVEALGEGDPLDGAADLCVQRGNTTCADTVAAWDKLIRGNGNPVEVAKPIGPFAGDDTIEVVLEMRHHAHPVNQAMTLTRGWFGKRRELQLFDYEKMKAFFDAFFGET